MVPCFIVSIKKWTHAAPFWRCRLAGSRLLFCFSLTIITRTLVFKIPSISCLVNMQLCLIWNKRFFGLCYTPGKFVGYFGLIHFYVLCDAHSTLFRAHWIRDLYWQRDFPKFVQVSQDYISFEVWRAQHHLFSCVYFYWTIHLIVTTQVC